MNAPTRPLVTIDDPVTIIEPHRVLLEYVDQVGREAFRVRSENASIYRHDAEGTTWARGHHLPDSEIVVALRAAASLVAPTEEKARGDAWSMLVTQEMLKRALPSAGVSGVGGFDLKRMMEEARKATEEARKIAEQTKKSWWQITWGK